MVAIARAHRPAVSARKPAPASRVGRFLAYGKAQVGKPYFNKSAARFGPRVFDCSGLVVAALRKAGINPSRVGYNSREQRRHTQPLPLSTARRTPGALLFRSNGSRGPGVVTHVAISLGDGRVLEATPPRVRITSFQAGRWNRGAGRVPGL